MTGLKQASLIDPQALMAVRSLELRARVVVEGFWTGLHRSPHHGFSVEFSEYRPYTPGDDTRHLDWRVFARSDRFFIKKFEEETNLRCHLVVDRSRSMTFGSAGCTKGEYAATLAATLGYFLYLQGDGVGLLTFDEQVRDFLPARHRSGHLRHLMLALEQPAAGRGTDLRLPLRRILESVRKRGLVVVLSDFLSPAEQLDTDLMALGASGHEVVVFQILDPAEVEFGYDSPAVFEDAESGNTLFIDPGSARKEYRRRFEAHGAELESRCRSLGMWFGRVVTTRALELVLFDFLRARMARGRTARVGGMSRPRTQSPKAGV